MNEEELKKQFNLFTTAWHFFRKWAIQAPFSEEQWRKLIHEAGEIIEKNSNVESMKYLMVTVIDMLDEIEKKMK